LPHLPEYCTQKTSVEILHCIVSLSLHLIVVDVRLPTIGVSSSRLTEVYLCENADFVEPGLRRKDEVPQERQGEVAVVLAEPETCMWLRLDCADDPLGWVIRGPGKSNEDATELPRLVSPMNDRLAPRAGLQFERCESLIWGIDGRR
jgi:hypothetical protein